MLLHVNSTVRNLFDHLINDLDPMDKQGPMCGRCEAQTEQMEMFLRNNFGFENIDGKYIVPGVRSFRVERLPSSSMFDMNTIIHFPHAEHDHPFVMTIDELRSWQKSYVVYGAKDNNSSIDKELLIRALQGQSREGEEAFRMKFVIRISTCPILMEFDACVISRNLNEDWPHRIKLVSVSGINFAGRMHDINDIFTYLTNWRDVFVLDKHTGKPVVYDGRDFKPVRNAPRGLINKKRLYDDLIRMARMRLRACDHEGVQIVVETGIGLGVFSGRQIGIDNMICSLSAQAVKQVLEEDGSKYSNIIAVVFALPIFETDESTSTYKYFVDAFENKYCGPVPVLIADQDMHRLTVAIARQGFVVSELNPADPYGVFGEYWQNRGPAVEGKLALTTVGLLVQHHLFNGEHVLNPENYKFIRTDNDHHVNKTVSVPPLYFNDARQVQQL
jgi:hypothetical protein